MKEELQVGFNREILLSIKSLTDHVSSLTQRVKDLEDAVTTLEEEKVRVGGDL